MRKRFQHKGFSLTEVLLAIGTLAIGMSFVGGTFFVGIHLSTVATERTIAAVVADEAFTKIQLYGFDPESFILTTNKKFQIDDPNKAYEFTYPSTNIMGDKQYYWSALCRPVSPNLSSVMQVTVFISRKVGSSLEIPVPVEVPVSEVTGTGNENQLSIIDIDKQSFINAGSKIVANRTGKLYRVVERDAVSGNIIILDIPWEAGAATDSVWVIPPTSGGKNPCIAVYQKEIRF
ncbi:MAG: type II secretion system protein [Sedimentisphaerales bacterium]|nr:type II secretion system protein [Sedimentisphaerales bacterium]